MTEKTQDRSPDIESASQTQRPSLGGRIRIAIFALLCISSLSIAVAYVANVDRRQEDPSRGAKNAQPEGGRIAAITAEPHVIFRNMAPGRAGRVGAVSLDNPDAARAIADLQCMRVYIAKSRGLCLTESGPNLLEPYNAVFFDADFKVRHTRPLQGVPSRARVSPDGRFGASTVFVSGDSYAADSFSTRTTLFDMTTAKVLGDLEQFVVWRDGSKISSPVFNFWGVSFARQTGRFYATLGTGGNTYLVRGDVRARRMDVLRSGVECPSLSPDGLRIAFKSKTNAELGSVTWQLKVLDLESLKDHSLGEMRNVDDQAEWLDNDTLVYAIDTGRGPPGTWSVSADGTGKPQPFIADADSPAVVRR